jgi:hypothetical protein
MLWSLLKLTPLDILYCSVSHFSETYGFVQVNESDTES